MNKLKYKINIETEKAFNAGKDLKCLILLDDVLSSHIILLKRLFGDFGFKKISDDDAQIFLEHNINKFDFVISNPFYSDGKTLITSIFPIPGNKKHIILLNDIVDTQDILKMSCQGNVLFLGNNLEEPFNIAMLTDYLNIIKEQKKIKNTLLKYEPINNKPEVREKVLIYTNVVVIKNILTKALEETSISKSRYDFVNDDKSFFNFLNENQAELKIVILTSEKPPLDEVKMITKLSKEIKIIYVASTKDDRLLKELSLKGVDYFIYKPFDFENIKENLRLADNKEKKLDTKIVLYSITELIENFNIFIQHEHIENEEKKKFKSYFKFLQ